MLYPLPLGSETNRVLTRSRVAHKKTNKEKRAGIESDLAMAGVVVVGVCYDKKYTPNWNKLIKDQNQLHQDIVRELAEDLNVLHLGFDGTMIDDRDTLRDDLGDDVGTETMKKQSECMGTLIYVGQAVFLNPS